jgi:hypothetical protein
MDGIASKRAFVVPSPWEARERDVACSSDTQCGP